MAAVLLLHYLFLDAGPALWAAGVPSCEAKITLVGFSPYVPQPAVVQVGAPR